VVGRDREVAFLVAGLIPEVRLLVAARVPYALDRVDEIVAGVHGLIEADIVEDEKFLLRAVEALVGETGRLQEGLRLLSDVAGITGIGLLRDRVVDVAKDAQGGHGTDRIDHRTRRIGQQDHIRFINLLKAPDRRAVEADAVLPDARSEIAIIGQLGSRYGEVLPEAGQIAEFQIDDLDLVFL